jgi:methylated-DNA-[protein]-cysteine S-methyltransferase
VDRYTLMTSRIDDLLLVAGDDGLRRVHMLPHAIAGDWRRADDDPTLTAAREQLHAYFAGALTAFEVDLAPHGTPFQRLVWDGLAAIPYGETRTYAQVADAIGAPGAARAVGLANGRNPIAVIIPCHRVIGADGSLTGYGGGLPRKRLLLELERETLGAEPERAVAAATA